MLNIPKRPKCRGSEVYGLTKIFVNMSFESNQFSSPDKKPLLPGKTEIMQMNLIIDLLGNPSENIWSGYSELERLQEVYTFKEQPYNNLKHR